MPGATPAKTACFLEHHADRAARCLITVNWDFGAPVTQAGWPLSSELGSMYPIYSPSSPPNPCGPSQRSWARPAERRNSVISDWPRVGAHARSRVGFSSACALPTQHTCLACSLMHNAPPGAVHAPSPHCR